ncbi:alpha/beta fold hydrolase [Rossellomorea aquimaris]|uniref:Beta-ketoadipate enol-lactone hydrolase n=1 Tax=Rossellomorea aquimaris TaxID=189382 RepID=A0A1J6W5Z6_9BACI|nr:alpha/beta hydrolase [Rossellomorea aquimaris]OIU72052.1 beta-ketoadipate enol-lactone hydrolase [Rossellomorea aquimaris]
MLEYKVHQEEFEEYVIFLHGIGGNSTVFGKQLNEFKKQYNVITIHLPGHGKSPSVKSYDERFSIELNLREVLKVMDHLNIDRAHFVGVSLGSIFIHALMQRYPHRVKSAVLAGCITRFSPFAAILLKLGDGIKSLMPFLWLYRIFAYIMMPKNNHAVSRKLFIREAKKMNRECFLSWYRLTPFVKSTYQLVQTKASHIPKMYISGREDHLFVKALEEDIQGDPSAEIVFLDDCGHVCNVEKPKEFNDHALRFLSRQAGCRLKRVQ